MASTIVGRSGRIYTLGEVLRKHPLDSKFNLIKAESEGMSFVLKRVPAQFYDISQRIADDVAGGSSHLRVHVDCNKDDHILVYPYFRDTMLALFQQYPDFPITETKKILRCVGEAIQDLHGKDWIHNDVKPDNILVDWDSDQEGNLTVTNAALGDFDIAYNLPKGAVLQTRHAVGNAMWRSPEAQTGRGMTMASDVYSFGLVCVFAMGGSSFLLINNYRELLQFGISPEQEILLRHFSFFGPVSEGLLKRIDSEEWSNNFKTWSKMAEAAITEHPENKFESWGLGMGTEAYSLISGIVQIDPTARSTIDQVLAHKWWDILDETVNLEMDEK
ncbi:kinase-like protein [Amniculicola lignicola CBS 123094]|uniref:Kinase-like protein n=1 Tax=Amniculicola lignicola CBS 123094 TaxID=1392246 RepID=A0A6A5VWV3_9PLEO|nr:kinase-like protein [Amniculicola lignicola CBS 123094]